LGKSNLEDIMPLFPNERLSCPKCERVIGLGPRDFGPPVVICKTCGTKIRTGFREWALLTPQERNQALKNELWMPVLLTLAPFLTLLVVGLAYSASTGNLASWFINFRLLLLALLVFGVIGSTIVINLFRRRQAESDCYTETQEPPIW
jgi:uncharacterized paraquat-inducible protein A